MPGYVVQFDRSKTIVDAVTSLAVPGYYAELGAKICVIVMEAGSNAGAFGEKVAAALNEPSLKFDVLPLESIQRAVSE